MDDSLYDLIRQDFADRVTEKREADEDYRQDMDGGDPKYDLEMDLEDLKKLKEDENYNS